MRRGGVRIRPDETRSLRGGVEHARGDHRVRSAEDVQRRDQHEAADGGTREVEEVRAVDALDGFETASETIAPARKNGSALTR
jgi:hypothetical protein